MLDGGARRRARRGCVPPEQRARWPRTARRCVVAGNPVRSTHLVACGMQLACRVVENNPLSRGFRTRWAGSELVFYRRLFCIKFNQFSNCWRGFRSSSDIWRLPGKMNDSVSPPLSLRGRRRRRPLPTKIRRWGCRRLQKCLQRHHRRRLALHSYYSGGRCHSLHHRQPALPRFIFQRCMTGLRRCNWHITLLMDDFPGGPLELDCILVWEPIVEYEFVRPPAAGEGGARSSASVIYIIECQLQLGNLAINPLSRGFRTRL